ncbi:MAG: hypothetical protein AAFO02_26320 [Bacteroidota bacterium]
MKHNQTKLFLLGGLVVLILGGLVIELPFSMNYLQVRSFWKTSVLLGLGLGIIAAVAALYYRWDDLADSVARMQLFFTVFFALLLTTPLFISWTNRLAIPTADVPPTTVTLESEQARFSSRFGSSRLQKPQANQYLLFFYRDGQLYRLQDDEPFFPDAEPGDTLQLNIIRGRLGYEWVLR